MKNNNKKVRIRIFLITILFASIFALIKFFDIDIYSALKNRKEINKVEENNELAESNEEYYYYEINVDEYDSIVNIEEALEKEITTAADSVSQIDTEIEKNNYKNVLIELDINNNPGFAILDIRCYFDENALNLQNVKNGDVHNKLDTNPVIQQDTYGTYVLLDFDYTGKNCTNNGVLAYLNFSIVDQQKMKNGTVKFVVQEACNSKPEYISGFILDSKVVKFE